MPKNLGQYNNDLSVPRKKDIDDLANVVDGKYSASNPPPYPVTSVNNKTGDVTLTASEVGAAPDGYGLGMLNVSPGVTDINQITKNGFYDASGLSTDILPQGVRSQNYAGLLSSIRADNRGNIIWLRSIPDAPTYIATAQKNNDALEPWEYLNPPLTSGTVSRTLDRYNDKVVYKKLDTDGVIKWSIDGGTNWKPAIEYLGYVPETHQMTTSDLYTNNVKFYGSLSTSVSYARLIDGTVTVFGWLQNLVSITSYPAVELATLPKGFRPKSLSGVSDTIGWGGQYSNKVPMLFSVNIDGVITAQTFSGTLGTNNQTIGFRISFIAA